MSLAGDLKVLYHLAFTPIRGRSHAERLESFYQGQAGAYDDFRQRLLRGRKEMMEQVPAPTAAVWLDMGGGTGANIEHLGERVGQLGHLEIVDLSASLLKVARQRIEQHGWANVDTVEADVTTYRPARQPVDVVTFSYSLTMIPDWFAAIDHAFALLRPGGVIGVVDFYVARKHSGIGATRHGWWTRTFWPTWFALDNVFLSSEHAPYLHRRFEPLVFSEHRAAVPYVPLGRVPYYVFIGRKRDENATAAAP